MSSSPVLPSDFSRCFEDAASRLGRALRKLEWPSGSKDAPCHEVNAIFSFAHCLGKLERDFQLYAEGMIGDRGRIDLIGCNGEIAFALEAKGWGAINKQSLSVTLDLERVRGFRPIPSELANDASAVDWWREAKQRFGILMITSFRGRNVADAWQLDSDDDVIARMSAYKPSDRALDTNGEPAPFLTLHKRLRFLETERGASPITDGSRWKDCDEGWLLWAAFPLECTPGNLIEVLEPSPPAQSRTRIVHQQ